MDFGKFLLSGTDKKALITIKNTLSSSGYIYVGYCSDISGVLRLVRGCAPELVFIEASGNVGVLGRITEVIDDDLLSACVLVIDKMSDDIYSLLKRTRITGYILKPVMPEAVLQASGTAMLNYRRIADYDQKVKKLSESLETRKLVEKAKWKLVSYKGLSEEAAYETIQKKSRDGRLPMKKVAEAILMAFD